MQVQLKQSELEAAVRQFLSKQGINLEGKDVEVKFSATRGDAGIVAMIDIDDVANDGPVLVPDQRPTLQVVSARDATDLAAGSQDQQKPPSDAAEATAGGEKKTSLFAS